MTQFELAALIETMQVKDSKVNDWMGKNVRCPSLVPGTLYIMKVWSTKHQANYDNPFTVVEFIGSGREDTGERILFAENPAIKSMQDGDYYYFKGVDKNDTFDFGAYMFENCVCITSSAVRITCFAINEHTSHDQLQGTTKPVATPRTAATTQSKKMVVASIDDDDFVCEVEDDGLGVKGALVCDRISMIPLRRQPEGFGLNGC